MPTKTKAPTKRVTGADRASLVSEVKKDYDGGLSVREIGEQRKLSYGFVHRLLVEGQATMRPRGSRGRV